MEPEHTTLIIKWWANNQERATRHAYSITSLDMLAKPPAEQLMAEFDKFQIIDPHTGRIDGTQYMSKLNAAAQQAASRLLNNPLCRPLKQTSLFFASKVSQSLTVFSCKR